MSATTDPPQDAERTNLLLDDIVTEEAKEASNVSFTADDERQSYILSNYSTLRTNIQWSEKSILNMIEKIASITIKPPDFDINKTVIARQEDVLQQEAEQLEKTKPDIVKSSCDSIIKYVANKSENDPLLSINNPYKQSEKKEEEDNNDDDNSSNEETEEKQIETHLTAEIPPSKASLLSSLDSLLIDDEEEEEEEKNAVDVLISDKILSDPCYRMLTEALNGNNQLTQIVSNDNDKVYTKKNNKHNKKKSCSWRQFKKSLKFTYMVGTRAFSLVDIVTDGFLLYTASSIPDLWFLTLALVISMASPYIISYSSGVQLYLFRQTFDNVEGFKKILMFLFLLPTGILYFIFLDLADILLHIFRWVYFVIFCNSLQEIGQTEQILSEQLGMDRMNWEGFKRQRSIGQLMFESLPQFLFQTIIFYVMKVEIDVEGKTISDTQLIVSIASAMINIITTTFKLQLEAKCCRSNLISYALVCIKARVGWVPQREHILMAATDYESGNIATIDYDMSHRPFVGCGIYKHSVEYDFSSTTIRYFMSALQMINNNKHKTTLRIHFQNSLRLLPLQDLIELYSLCSKKKIEVMSLKGGSVKYDYDWSSAIEISKNYGKDARLIKYSRDDQGLPYIMKLMQLSHYSDRRKIFRDLIEHDFDLNIHDLTTNESIVYTLIRSYDYKNLRYIFTKYSKDKGVLIRLNYHNKDGISPLGVALKLYWHELEIRTQPMPATANTDPSQVPFLWELLVKHGAELSFPCKKNYSDSSNEGDMSPLQYVLAELRHKRLARHLMMKGAQLYSKEIGSLNELFVNYELYEEANYEYPANNNNDNTDIKDDNPLSDDDDEWDADDDFVAHETEREQDDSWLALLCDVAKNCHRPIDFITDDFGNNPLHHFINDFNDKNKHKTRSHKLGADDNKLRLKRLRHLMFICNRAWSNEKNSDGLYPYQLIIKKKDPALFFEFAELDSNFKQNIMEKKEFVQEMIDWIIAITERITKKYPSIELLAKDKKSKKYVDERVQKDVDVQTLNLLFKPKYLGKLIKWPNKYKKVMKAEPISLMGTALFERKLVQVVKYLNEIWRIVIKKTEREKIKELEDEMEHRKAIGAEYSRSKSRYNMLSRQKKAKAPASSSNIMDQMRINNHNNYTSKASAQAAHLHNAPAPVLRQHTLMQMVNNKQITDVSDKIDVDIMGHIDRINAHMRAQHSIKGNNESIEASEHKKSSIETVYSFFVEALSTADFITDILVVMDLIKVRQVWSISLMLLFMISPYLVSHSIMCSLIDSRRESIKLDLLTSKKKGCWHCNLILINILALILMTPLAIAWFTFVDVLFMVYLLLSTAVFLSTCAKIDISDKMDDLLFKRLLGMSRMQIIGYRRLRTLSQLLFETLPQIALQAYILYYDDKKGGNQLNATEIYISIGVAGVHVLLELFIIYLDARASKMSLTHYAVICLGARLNWVPFAHQIRTRKKQRNRNNSKAFYNFECVQFQPWFFVPFGSEFMYRIEYEFSPSSIKKLGEYFINLQILSSTDAPSNPYLAPVWLYLYKKHTLPVIYLGKTCCRSLDVYSFAEFFRSADKKVTLKSSQLDWTRIIFENTPNTSADNVYLKRLCQEFINYAEIKLITQLAPEVDFSTSDVLLYILDPAQQQSQFNILLILKKYYDENIHFGLSREIMSAVYKIINNNNETDWISNNEADPSYSKVIFLLMWYTRRTIYRHQSPRGDLKFSHDPIRENFLATYRDETLPSTFEVRYDSNAISCSDRYDDGVNKMRTIILNETHSDPQTIIKDEDKSMEGSQSNYIVSPDWNEEKQQNGTYVVNLADEEDSHEIPFPVEFEILECFKYFQPQIETFLVDLTLRLKHRKEYLRIGDKALFKFFKKVLNKQSVDFLKLIINSPWFMLQNFPVHVRFAQLFSRIDPVVRRLEMIHGYGHYLLASKKYRQSNRKKPMLFMIQSDYDSFEDDELLKNQSVNHDENEHLLKNQSVNQTLDNQNVNQILDIQTDPAYDGHKSMRAASTNDFIKLPKQMEMQQKMQQKSLKSRKGTFKKCDIMGISRIEIEFDTFEAKDTKNHIYDEEKGESMGKIELFTVLPQRTKILNDKLMLNKVVLKEMTFEELMQSKDSKLIVDLFDNEILGMFRPIYIGRDRIDLMPLKLNIQPTRATIRVTCFQIRTRITYLFRKFIDATAMKFESVLHKACLLQNVECVQFIREYQDIFDCNAVNDHYENALHILCKMDDPNLEIFSLVLELNDLDINQVRFDGKTAFQVLEANTNIDVEKKNEMLKDLSSQPSYTAIAQNREKEEENVRNVLLIGAKNSGRHSLLKQLQIHYEKRLFTSWQKSVFRSQIIKYMICSMKLLIKHCGDDNIASLVNLDARHIYCMNADNLETMEHFSAASFASLRKLWSQAAIQRVFYAAGERLGLTDSVAYFFAAIDRISSHAYVASELDILRVPHNEDSLTVLNSKSYRLDDDSTCDHNIQIRWICPNSNNLSSAYKLLRSYCSETYHNIDTCIFMVSLTSFVESNKYVHNDNYFIQSLKLFQQIAHNPRFNGTKLVLIFNKSDILKNKISRNDDILQHFNLHEDNNTATFDGNYYWDYIDLFQAMFRCQHNSRTVFSYPLSAAQPAKIRSILKELEDIIIQSDVPSIINSNYYREKALVDVCWCAKLKKSDAQSFEFNLKSVSQSEIAQIKAQNNIDYNAMLYKTKQKVVHFLISQPQKAKHIGFVWAKWNKSKFENIPSYRQAKGFWQTIDVNNEIIADLNGILAILHHKELRTQFDGFTISDDPIRITFESHANIYNVSWWNMARMNKCNAITVNNEHYLHFQSPLNNDKIEWLWYDNDNGESTQYDKSCVNQLEAAYLANLESNFHKSVTFNFNHSILTNLQTFMVNVANQNNPSYVLRFGFNQNNINQNIQISHITQLRIYPDKNDFARDVQRTYDGRNSAWPV